MGWFLSKKKKRKRRRRKLARHAAEPWDPRRTLAGLKFLALAVLFVLLVGAWQFSERYLTGYVSRHRQGHVTADRVVLAGAAPWMDSNVRREIQKLAADQFNDDPFDRDSLTRCLVALQASPWVRNAMRVERDVDRVVVYAVYRKPIAAVAEPLAAGAARQRYHWVDAAGIRLPVTGKSLDEIAPELPVIVGVESRPEPPGHIWPGDDVQAGLALAQYLAGQPCMGQIKALDVSARDDHGRIHIFLPTDAPRRLEWPLLNHRPVRSDHAREALRKVLQTSHRTGVIWGLPPGQEQSIDPDAQSKLVRLISVHDRYHGSIDARGKVVDISGAAAFVLQPLYESDR